MSPETGMHGSTNANETADLDAQGAAAIVQQTRQQAEQALTINRPAILGAWALVYLLGYGAVWLSVREQRPYHAPAAWALTLLIVLAVVALAFTAGVRNRATSGVGGLSALKHRIYSLSLVTGLLGVIIMQAALRHNGADPGVIGVFQASGPLLVAGMILVAATAAWLNWYMFGLGIWLIAVAAVSGFAGPADVWAVDALAVGVPLLLLAVIRPVPRRP
jgi:hypothetical protein